ncbi:MAG TPA: nucleoside deaminase [Marinobacter sp.]|nr:nucleoside deaminase [Marinobacter sp.]
MTTKTDHEYLTRCVELAAQAVESGNPPFGSVLVDESGAIRFEGHNETSGGDSTRHPEFEIARWAAENMTPAERAAATVYTSGEHCPMCAAAHGWVGLGRIVYASSSQQLVSWLKQLNVPLSPVATLSIREVVPTAQAEGPFAEFAEPLRALHARFHASRAGTR